MTLSMYIITTIGYFAAALMLARWYQTKQEKNILLQRIANRPMPAVILADADQIMQDAHPTAAALFGHELDELRGQHLRMLMNTHDAAAHDGYIERLERTGEPKIAGLRQHRVLGVNAAGEQLEMWLFPSRSECTKCGSPQYMSTLTPAEAS